VAGEHELWDYALWATAWLSLGCSAYAVIAGGVTKRRPRVVVAGRAYADAVPVALAGVSAVGTVLAMAGLLVVGVTMLIKEIVVAIGRAFGAHWHNHLDHSLRTVLDDSLALLGVGCAVGVAAFALGIRRVVVRTRLRPGASGRQGT